MEKRLNARIEKYIREFKENIATKTEQVGLAGNEQADQLMQYIFDYDRLILEKDDFIKRKRVKNVVPYLERCSAKRATDEQCTRRKKDGHEFCGTHTKGIPHGIMCSSGGAACVGSVESRSIEVWVQEISGIMYYIDNKCNVYAAEDVVGNKLNPQIISSYECKNGVYSLVSKV
jgi:hypothetical protein